MTSTYLGQLFECRSAVVTHDMPAADMSRTHYLAYVGLEPFGLRDQVEQLWLSRPAEEEWAPGRFVVSCIPFCAYGIARGDVVELGAKSSAVARVVRRSGCASLRLLIRRRVADDPEAAAVSSAILEAAASCGYATEHRRGEHIAIDLRRGRDDIMLIWESMKAGVESGWNQYEWSDVRGVDSGGTSATTRWPGSRSMCGLW